MIRRSQVAFVKNPASFAILLAVLLFVVNVVKLPAFVGGSALPGTLSTLAPFVIAAIASTPALLAGGGGIDLSIGPTFGLVNALIVATLLPRGLGGPGIVIPLALATGTTVGLVNGFMVAVVRIQPIVATLGTYLVLEGIAIKLLPQPIGQVPAWIADMSNSYGPVPGGLILMAVPALIWFLITRTRFHKTLLEVGGDERAAFSSGVNVTLVRIVTYGIGGLFAGIGGLAMTALIQSGDATIGPQYTLIAVAAVALGGTSLLGGRGGIIGSIFGAIAIFLIQNVLSAFNVSTFWVQIAYGAILIGSLVLSSSLRRWRESAAVVI